ncbi:MAG: hypothetical protein IPK13_25520 [Deltaproteobacteria bacterium]|nr:hypothetical protein [Deltaproteobacteria bacterium]
MGWAERESRETGDITERHPRAPDASSTQSSAEDERPLDRSGRIPGNSKRTLLLADANETRAMLSNGEVPAKLLDVLARMDDLLLRVARIDRGLSEVRREVRKVRKSIRRLRGRSAKAKDVKKLKNLLDQLDVIEVGPGDCRPDPMAMRTEDPCSAREAPGAEVGD